MTRRSFYFVAYFVILIFVLTVFLTACAAGGGSLETAELTAAASVFENAEAGEAEGFTAGLVLPPQENNTTRNRQNANGVLTLDLSYENISLHTLYLLLQSIIENQWYLKDNTAYKGNRSATIDYNLKTKIMAFHFTQNTLQKEWPEALSPYLAYSVPAFPYGENKSCAAREIPGSQNASLMVYTGVAAQDMEAYQQTLVSAGFQLMPGTGGEKLFKKDALFVTTAYDDLLRGASVTVGSYTISAVPLPPWPDPFPEQIKRILAPVAAACTVNEGGDDGYFARAEGLSLSKLYAFYAAMAKNNGWTEPDEDAMIRHAQTGFVIVAQDYSTSNAVFTFSLYNDLGAGETASASPSQTVQDEGFDDGLADYDFVLTQGYYTDAEAMDGVLDEFGQTAEMANWDEIKQRYADRFELFLNALNVKANEDIWLLHGKSGFDGNRHYFLARIAGQPRTNFKRYDNVGDEAWLGSWYGIKLRIMVKKQVPGAGETASPSKTTRDEGFDDGLADYDFVLTQGYYTETQAMDGVLDEFGQTAEMANWEEIKQRYANRFELFLNSLAVKANEDIWLLYKKSGFDGNRHYFLARIAGQPRADFKRYDRVGDEAWLGSWYGIKLRIMVKKPAATG
jgi:hypothetical protein